MHHRRSAAYRGIRLDQAGVLFLTLLTRGLSGQQVILSDG